MPPRENAVITPFVATEPALENRRLSASAPVPSVSPLLEAAIRSACMRIAPLWPLKTFVAVNPFLGLSDQTYSEACRTVYRNAHGELLMPADFYLAQVERGWITEGDLQRAIDEHGRSMPDPIAEGGAALTPTRLIERLRVLQRMPPSSSAGRFRTVADALDAGGRWTRLTTEEISKWCAAHFDEGQASWQSPWRTGKPYVSWRRTAQFDRNAELNGLRRFRRHIAQLPFDPVITIGRVMAVLEVPEGSFVDFLHRALMSIAGWSAYVQYRVRERNRAEQEDDSLLQLLAIRLAYDYALFIEFGEDLPDRFWHPSGTGERDDTPASLLPEASLFARHLAQQAYEHAFHRRTIERLRTANAYDRSIPFAHGQRPEVAAVFCIDVRSEVFRRALESQSQGIRTHGFAGFFGVPIEYVPLGHNHGPAQCPVLIKPRFRVRETIAGAGPREVERILSKRIGRKRAARAWKAFKSSAVSCFSYVETFGLLFAPKLVSDTLGLTRPVAPPSQDSLEGRLIDRLGPTLDFQPATDSGSIHRMPSGISREDRVELARNALRGMGLTGQFARLVLLCGHGSTTVNNPYAAGLNCGACGGHSGEANARTAAAILNDPWVRAALADEGLTIPPDTWFLAALHDTTTDAVTLYDPDRVPWSHRDDLVRLRQWLDAASRIARRERAPRLGITGTNAEQLDRRIEARSRDWSQVRPEWGLAGNAIFIAASRDRTRTLNLEGRAFLHDYDSATDPDGSLLELIMTAPMVVASWINLQYFASTVDPELLGSGNKTLHNVVGTLGVFEGNGGDLRAGLPYQSVHDGQKFVHEPLRLMVFIEAPTAAIDRVIARHAHVRELVANGWVHLFAIADEGKRYLRHGGSVEWQPTC
ncbi:DUF2309 domain-containing protein [Methylolobus aquaticus]|nr:DUF2309 domain-containing protein [Methylolobus aquaticus]